MGFHAIRRYGSVRTCPPSAVLQHGKGWLQASLLAASSAAEGSPVAPGEQAQPPRVFVAGTAQHCSHYAGPAAHREPQQGPSIPAEESQYVLGLRIFRGSISSGEDGEFCNGGEVFGDKH